MNDTDADGCVKESKALRLAQYLKEFAGLRSSIIRNVDQYETVLWFNDMPQEAECHSPAWDSCYKLDDPWLEVRKQKLPKPPQCSGLLLPWLDQKSIERAYETPALRSIAYLPNLNAERNENEEPPLLEHNLQDHPEVEEEFNLYLPKWKIWSIEYKRREEIQKIYTELFYLYNQLKKQSEIFELVLGFGLLDWQSSVAGKSIPIRRHVVTAKVDLQFNIATSVIRLKCSAEGAQLLLEDEMLEAELRPEPSHYTSVKEQLSSIGDDVWDRTTMFTALKSWAESLMPNSQWSSELKPCVGEKGNLLISFAPALILRKRTQRGMVRIYDAIINQLKNTSSELIPNGWLSLVSDEDDQDIEKTFSEQECNDDHFSFDSKEIYFPLPANIEQQRIVEAIKGRRGVLVQGPPGTGKSHTIANLMCHLLATGKRVLITAETEHALKVLKSKLPEEIQPLCISYLGQGSDTFSELNSAVQGITTRFASWFPGAYDKRISELESELDAAKRSLAKLDSKLRSLREEEISTYSLVNGIYKGSASEIAQHISNERKNYGWLQLPQDSKGEPLLSSDDLKEWLRICRSNNEKLVAETQLEICSINSIPTPVEFSKAVAFESEAKAEALLVIESLNGHPAYSAISTLKEGDRVKLANSLQEIEESRRKISKNKDIWIKNILTSALSGRLTVWHSLQEQTYIRVRKIEEILNLLPNVPNVTLPETIETRAIRADVEAIHQHFKVGGKWTSWKFITPRVVKERTYIREQIRIDGQFICSEEQLDILIKFLDLIIVFEELEKLWSDHCNLPSSSDMQIRFSIIKEYVALLDDVLNYAKSCILLSESLASEYPLPIPEPDWLTNQVQEWLKVIEAASINESYQFATKRVTSCLCELKTISELHNAHPINNKQIEAIESRDISAYSENYEKIKLIECQREELKLQSKIEATLNDIVPGFVKAVVQDIDEYNWDERFSEWEKAWKWAIVDRWLQDRADMVYQQQLITRRDDVSNHISQLISESAALRAWTYFFNRLTSTQAAALKSWREAVKAIGMGTGSTAKIARLRREANQCIDQCRDAIPVWIKPKYLVAESIEPAPGLYDVIIVDEASQLGIESLFLFYISNKMIVVGDDQQISPYGIGITNEAVASLQDHYLKEVPHQHALSPQSSLYANAKIRFGQNIVLREHFRCMPEIIQFSNDLCYASNGTALDPLRSYTANRLDPLVCRHIPEGYRTGDGSNALNMPEADAIVTQILTCIADPRYIGRSMGVISLQGQAQAKYINRKLIEKLEPEIIEERRLICGDAYDFQGDERDIIFLSMVAAPSKKRIGVLSNESARQRFNVAVSRARDQLWLFHTATLNELSTSCMRYRLLKYMLYPTREIIDIDEQLFESQFERDVYQLISNKGFRVKTQVCVGDPTNHRYRIDLVVEGIEGRLAVECDGDKWHGPERYEYDMARQRDLERVGWQFVRIRGSDFYRDPECALNFLWTELKRLGIKPQSAVDKPKYKIIENECSIDDYVEFNDRGSAYF